MRLVIPPPVQLLICVALMWVAARAAPYLSVDAAFLKAVGVTLIAGGILLEVAAVIVFIRNRTTPNPLKPENARVLITDGLYRISRNPMYLGIAIVLTGWFLWLGNLLSFPVIPLFLWYNTQFQIKPEEEALEEKFGDDYRTYKNDVRRWV